MNRVLLPLLIGLVLAASGFAAGVQNITIDANGNVLNSTATNYATGQLKVNGVAVGGGGGGGSGTVTSVGISGANGIAVSGTPITTAGTIALSLPITLAGTTGKTFTLSNSLTLAGTDGSTLNIGSGGTLGTAAYTAASAYATSGQGTKADNAGAVNGIVKSNGSAVFSAVTDNSSNWDTAYTDRLKWDGGATGLVAATGRTSLGATTVGSNIFSLTNPSAITFLQINADNTVTANSASAQRTALGLGTLATQSGTFSGTSSGTNTGDQIVPANTTATGSNFFTAYNSTTGAFTKAQPAFSDISGSATVAQLPAAIPLGSLGITIDGAGSAITTGTKGYITVPYACTIQSATMLADVSGSAVVDVWKTSYANFDAGATHPVAGDKITASAPPTISSATKSQDTTLTGWTTNIAAGDVIAFNVNSASTIKRLTLILKVTK
jgi:hypothetical protein